MTKNELIQTLAGIVRVQNPQGCEAIRALLLEASNLVKAPEPPPMPTAPSFNDGLPQMPKVNLVHPDTMLLDDLQEIASGAKVNLAYSLDRQIYRAITGGKVGEGGTLREALEDLTK